MEERLMQYADKAVELLLAYGPKFILAIITLFVGLWMIRVAHRGLDVAMDRANVEPTLQRFLLNLTNILLKGALFVSVITMIGVETSTFRRVRPRAEGVDWKTLSLEPDRCHADSSNVTW